MKSIKVISFSVVALFFSVLFPATSSASGIDIGNFIVTVPDSITVTGQEVGTGSRNCTFNASLDAKPGFVIPLRGGVVISLIDSLNTSIDNGYTLAEVEGLTHLDVKGVFHCAASSGTLKPPYKFSIMPRGLPSTQVFGYESPVTLQFVQTTPTPKPSVSASPTPTPSATSTSGGSSNAELAIATERIASLQSENESLKSRLSLANASLKLVNSKLAKICGAKPKPRGC